MLNTAGPFLYWPGGTAGAELMLHLVAKKHGPDLGTTVADYLVLAKVRMEGDEQRMPYHVRYRTRNKILLQALEHMNWNSPLKVVHQLG